MVEKAIQETESGVSVTCWVQPRASKNKVVGLHGDAVKIAITAPPVDGKANAAIVKFMSKLLGVGKSSIEIASGQNGRNKIIKITGVSLTEFKQKSGL